MARTRGLLTDRDREVLSSGEKNTRYYQVVSEVRARIQDNLSEDVDILAENHPELYDELQDVVCNHDGGG